MLNRRTALGMGLAACVLPAQAIAATHEIMVTDGLALGGIDPMSYRLDGAPVAGDPAFRIMWRDEIWRFADKARLDAFERDPLAHSPAYGGYCAYALAKGSVAPSDPAIFDIVEGRLFLNQSARVRDLWLTDVPGHVAQADARWPQILA